MQICATEQNIT